MDNLTVSAKYSKLGYQILVGDRDLQILKLRDGAINVDRLTFSNIEVVK